MLARRHRQDRHNLRMLGDGDLRNLLGAVMAMPMDAGAVPVVVGKLVLAARVGRVRGDGGNLGRGLAGDRIDRPAEHDAEQQDESCKAPRAAKGEPEEHAWVSK